MRLRSFSLAAALCGAVLFLILPGPCGCARAEQPPVNRLMQDSEETLRFKAAQQQKIQAYLAQFGRENKEFLAAIGKKPRDEKILALKDFIRGQYDKNCAFRAEMYRDQQQFVQARLDATPFVRTEMKEKVTARIGRDYEALKAFHAGKLAEDMQVLDGLLKNKSIDGRELNVKLQAFFRSQKDDARAFLESQQQKYRASGAGQR